MAKRRASGLRIWILPLGETEGDAGWFIEGANHWTVADPRPIHQLRRISMYAVLIEHPQRGLLLYDVGPAPDRIAAWGPGFMNAFPWVTFEEEHLLDRAIAKTGHSIGEVSGIIISHLHLDHAGGLEYFRGSDVPVYVHADEFENAFSVVATGEDVGVYQAHYLDVDFNWQLLRGETTELFEGLALHRTPGHTPGLMGLLADLRERGPLYFSSDQLPLRENHVDGLPLGWLMRDRRAWHESRRRIQRLVDATGATVVYGHDPVNFQTLATAPEHHD